MAETYIIRTIADIEQIPDDRLADFFTDIAQSFAVSRAQREFFRSLGIEPPPVLEELQWTDDGKGEFESVYLAPDGAVGLTIKAKENANE